MKNKRILKMVVIMSIIIVMILTISVMAEIEGDKTKSVEEGLFGLREKEIEITEDNFRIKCLRENGVLIGDENGNLQLGETLKRQEMVVLISRLMGKEEEAKAWDVSGLTFLDVEKDNWAAPYIAWAKDNNITKGYSEGWFGYNDELTKEQTEIFLVRVLGFENAEDEIAIEIAKMYGIVEEENTGLKEAIRRAEVGKMLYNTIYAVIEEEGTLGEKLEIEEEYTREEVVVLEYLENYDVEVEKIERIDDKLGIMVIDFNKEEITEEMILKNVEELRKIADRMNVKILGITEAIKGRAIKVTLFNEYGVVAKVELDGKVIYDVTQEDIIEIK